MLRAAWPGRASSAATWSTGDPQSPLYSVMQEGCTVEAPCTSSSSPELILEPGVKDRGVANGWQITYFGVPDQQVGCWHAGASWTLKGGRAT